MGPIIFNKEIVGMGEVNYITYIPLNDEIDDIPELNIKYQPTLEVYPTISHKCFDEMILKLCMKIFKHLLLKMI